MKALLASALMAAVLVAGGIARPTLTPRATATSVVPACPSPSYGADGNMEPIFCVIDNPVALRYFAKGAPHLFALGRNATPDQVIRALEKDFNTEPIGCSEYRLAAWKNHWHFGISPVQAVQLDFHLPKGWCSEPRFNVRY